MKDSEKLAGRVRTIRNIVRPIPTIVKHFEAGISNIRNAVKGQTECDVQMLVKPLLACRSNYNNPAHAQLQVEPMANESD